MFSDKNYLWFAAAGGKEGLQFLGYCAGFSGGKLQAGLCNL
jgi:hypothetical protein